jgi:predicted nuclease of restriction endonuclease-like RecB superfamily
VLILPIKPDLIGSSSCNQEEMRHAARQKLSDHLHCKGFQTLRQTLFKERQEEALLTQFAFINMTSTLASQVT